MRKLIIYFLILFANFQLALADCEFSIINYTDSAVSAKVGFFGKVESSLYVPPAEARVIKLQSEYHCNDATSLGTGRVYIMFPKDPSGAGATYSPVNNQINLLGKFTGIENGRPMQADNGKPIWLNYTGNAITENKFEVKLNFVSRPNSFSAGTQ